MWGRLRKFGLEHCDLPTMMWNVSFMLRALTINIDSRYPKRIPIITYVIAIFIAASYFYVYLVSMMWFVFWRCRETGDLVAAMVVLSLGVTSEISTTKLLCIMLYRNKVRDLVDQYLKSDSLVKPGSRFSRNLMKTLRFIKKRAMIFWAVIIGNGIVYCVKAALMPGRHLMEDFFILYGLEPSKETPNYEISFLLETCGVIFTCYLPANITAFLIIIAGYTEAQMLALSEEILNVWNDAINHYNEQTISERGASSSEQVTTLQHIRYDYEHKNKVANEYVKAHLREIIGIHTTNINLLRQVEHVFRGAIAFEFILLIVGLIVELLGGLENTYMEVPYALMQVAMDCLTGQRVMDASMTFEKAVYACKWENFDKRNMKTVLLMVQISQKTMKLSAGYFYQSTMWESVRKFGIEYHDLPTMIDNVSFMLRALTINIDPRNTKPIPTSFYIITSLIAASYFYVYFISMAWFVFWRCWETGDLIAAMIVFSLGTSSEIGTTKLLFMIIYRNKVRKIVEQLLYYDSLVQPDSRFGKNVMKQLRHVKKRAMIFWIVIIGNGVLYISIALLTPGRHLPEDIFTLYGLEPSTQSPNYETSFLLMTGGTIFTVYLPANITGFLIIITGYIEAQMLALSEELLNVWSDASYHHSDQTTSISETGNSECIPCEMMNILHTNHSKHINEYIKVELCKTVQRHVSNINLSHEIENIFRGAIAVEFMLLVVGLLAELLGGLENTYVEVPYALMQVAMDCLTGQRLIDASMTFEAAVYACKWENFDVTNVKTIQLLLLNSQKTMKLSAGGITVLNFCSLMMIIRSIYSAYTTLGSILN